MSENTLEEITWTSAKRKISELVPWPKNPRHIEEDEAYQLQRSLKKFNQVLPFAIGPNGDVYDGHQRLKVMTELAGAGIDAEVDVRISNRPLTEEERKELSIRLHTNVGGWDFDTLGNHYELEELAGWGFPDELLGYAGFKEIKFETPPPQQAPELESEVVIEIRCGYDDLEQIMEVLDEWHNRDGFSVNVSQ